jgi:hypothetical protein
VEPVGGVIHITTHAIERFIERIAACTTAQAREHILSHSKAIHAAADFHCDIVRLGDGSRLVLDGTRVLTVYGRGNLPRQCRRSPRHQAEAE